ncbi:MAG: DUF932 domain-containing protein [Nitrospinae bacterium]|nr:DUF932 domain-containing protein [Nitrospinota bacterium]
MEWMNEKPWNGLGVDVSANLSPRELVYKLKLDFEVSRVPSGLPKSFANQEMFQFFRSFMEHGDALLETIGVLDNGRIVWALASLKQEFILKEADRVKGYLLLASRDENRDRIEAHFIAVRSAGSNTLQIISKARISFKNVCRRSFNKKFPFVSMKPNKFEEGMIRKTKEAVGLGREAISAFGSDAERLANKKVDDQIANRYMFNVFQPDMANELSSIGTKEINELADQKTRIGIEAIKKAPGQNLEPANMTAWGLLNAVIYTIDHRLGSNQDSRLRLAWFGPNAKIKKRAFELALEL